jgi:hypothetical protein
MFRLQQCWNRTKYHHNTRSYRTKYHHNTRIISYTTTLNYSSTTNYNYRYLLPVTPSVVVVLCPVTPSVVVVLCQLCKLSGFKYIKQIKNRKLYKTTYSMVVVIGKVELTIVVNCNISLLNVDCPC